MSYTFLLVLAVILLSTKILGLASGKVNMPQVVGALLAGLILGPSILNIVSVDNTISVISELGVIMLMFSAGLETDLAELKKTGLASFVIALAGVVLPLVCGAGLYLFWFRGEGDPQAVLKAIFVGVILTATSVSITVETLKEMGKLKGRVGTAILGAAVIDDILGIIALTVVSSFTNPDIQIHTVLIKIVLFFVFIAVVGFFVYKYFSHLNNAFNEKMHRRVAIYGLAFCLLLSFASEQFFGVADITRRIFRRPAAVQPAERARLREPQNRNLRLYAVFSGILRECRSENRSARLVAVSARLCHSAAPDCDFVQNYRLWSQRQAVPLQQS